jgi:hypothetical protein
MVEPAAHNGLTAVRFCPSLPFIKVYDEVCECGISGITDDVWCNK